MPPINDWDIAIVGMAGRFPGAATLDQFWQNLARGVESIAQLSDREILDAGVPASLLENPAYVKAAPVLDDPGAFDAGFFGLTPMEARTMDPQHRILLELAHEALENAGYAPGGRVGVFAGCALNTYVTSLGLHRRLTEDYIPTLIGNDKDFLSTRISYKLNLRGPSITVQTACSTSLVAVHLACQSLRSEESDMALAGAVSVRVPHRAGYVCDAGGVVSPDGHVRAFDARANGTVFGSGGGIVVLKRLTDALAAGDTIRAVIKGSAVNNDGSAKAGYTAPSVDSQADAVVEALANAGVEADSIGYVEAHGSGTPVGDPIEVRALTKAFRTSTSRSGFCGLGSVKTNVGHLDAAAGVAGIIKTVLALEHRQLPPSLHFTAANPEIDFPSTPFYVNTALRTWESDGGRPRRAGVMSTGMGGTNAHLVLEEAPAPEPRAATGGLPELLVWSAKSEAALAHAGDRLRAFLRGNDAVDLSDVAYTLQAGRTPLPHRCYLVCSDREDAVRVLDQEDSKRPVSGRADDARRPVVLLLPGLGDHYVGMGADLYDAWPVFRQEVDRCARILEPHLGIDIRRVLYPESQRWRKVGGNKGIDLKKMLGRDTEAAPDPDSVTLNRTLYAQPAMFTVEYATACVWQALGVTPDAIVGHSMGEYVAACLAGVLSLEDALRLIATRAKLVDPLPHGAMLAVTLPEAELRPILPDDLSISLINGPRLCVVAGPAEAVARFEKTLEQREIIARRVQNAHAFHSRMLDPIVPALEDEVRKIRLQAPRMPYISNVTGTWITAEQATDPAYWALHATRTARFADALADVWRLENPILLEAGPGRTLGVLAMQHPARRDGAVSVSTVRHHYENQSDVEFLLHAVGRMWLAGARIDWEGATDGRRRRIPLPTYPFERRSYWIESSATPTPTPVPAPIARVDDWFYVPTWERTPYPTELAGGFWLVIADRSSAGLDVKTKLDARGVESALVWFGQRFHERFDGSFEVRPGELEDYVRLFRAIEPRAARGLNIVHLGSVTRPFNQEFGFYSLLAIAQALGELNLSVPVKLGVISNGVHEVTGEERLDPEKATVLGPCGVIPKEYPNVTCFNVDLPDTRVVDERLLAEFAGAQSGAVVAYRGRYRWKRGYQKISLPGAKRRLKTGGVYLITGGTGGLGLAISKYLAAACRPTLVLTKQTPALKPGTTEAIQEIEALGARVEVMVAEASDRGQMHAVVAAVLKKFGAIDGVIHAAGIVRAGVIQAKTRETAARVMAPKVNGTLILYDLLRAAKPDFLVLFSSITTVSTPYAEADYVAANAFLDAFTYFANAEARCHTLTINWPGWKEVGQLADLETLPGVEGWKEAALERAIATEDGVEAFQRALSSGLKQVVVSPHNLEQVLADARAPFDPEAYLRPRRHESRAVAGGDALQQIWCDVLGLEQIGVHERFSDLGGHSLLAMQIVAKIRSSYQISFTLRDFFEAPTIAEARALIEERVLAQVESLSEDEARALLSQS
jgi:acyl transferase domain-containing protein